MSKDKNYELKDLIIDACDSLDEQWKDIQEGHYDVDDTIHEIADSSVPIYYWDIAQYAAHNHELMMLKPGLYQEGMTAHEQIVANIYEHILEGLFQHKEEKEDD